MTTGIQPVRVGVVSVDAWKPPVEEGATFRYVDIGSIDRDAKCIVAATELAVADAPSRARQHLRSHDVLVSTVRPSLNAVAMVPPELDGAVGSTGFTVLRADPKQLLPQYLFHWVRTPQFVAEMAKHATGANYPAVSERIVLDSRMPMPNVSEQRRIADMLDKADAIRRKRKQAIALTDALLGSAFLDMFGDPVTNPKGWPIGRLGDVIESVDAGWSANGEPRTRRDEEYGVLKVSAVTSGVFMPEEHKAVPLSAVARDLVTPRAGDLLFSRANTRQLVGATCLVEQDEPRLFLPDKLWRVVPREQRAVTPYLKFLLTNERFRFQLAQTATGTSGSMLNVSMQKLRGMQAPTPPFRLQQQFAEVVWATLRTKRFVESAQAAAQNLFGSLVERAFKGGMPA